MKLLLSTSVDPIDVNDLDWPVGLGDVNQSSIEINVQSIETSS